MHEFGIQDGDLSRIVKRCQELPGQELFQYVDARGRRRAVGSGFRKEDHSERDLSSPD